jgi:hypothetical protein
MDSAVQDDRPSLADPAVVDRLVREFALDVLDLDLQRPDLLPMLDFLARRMNSLFLAAWDGDYRVSNWNGADQLGESILLHYMINGETRLGVRDACFLFVDRLLSAIKHDESAEPLIVELRDALLGPH